MRLKIYLLEITFEQYFDVALIYQLNAIDMDIKIYPSTVVFNGLQCLHNTRIADCGAVVPTLIIILLHILYF